MGTLQGTGVSASLQDLLQALDTRKVSSSALASASILMHAMLSQCWCPHGVGGLPPVLSPAWLLPLSPCPPSPPCTPRRLAMAEHVVCVCKAGHAGAMPCKCQHFYHTSRLYCLSLLVSNPFCIRPLVQDVKQCACGPSWGLGSGPTRYQTHVGSHAGRCTGVCGRLAGDAACLPAPPVWPVLESSAAGQTC